MCTINIFDMFLLTGILQYHNDSICILNLLNFAYLIASCIEEKKLNRKKKKKKI